MHKHTLPELIGVGHPAGLMNKTERIAKQCVAEVAEPVRGYHDGFLRAQKELAWLGTATVLLLV